MENTLKEYKRIWRIRQDYFAVYGKYANRHNREPISANFRPNREKTVILNHLLGHDRMGKKTMSRYCPFKDRFFIEPTSICQPKTPFLTLFVHTGPYQYSVHGLSVHCTIHTFFSSTNNHIVWH